MPKKVYEEEEIEEDDVEEDDDEEDLEEEEISRQNIKVSKKKTKDVQLGGEVPEAPKKRYMAFANPARVGVADSETGEVVGEGDAAILEILADMKCDLEIIKNTLGNMVE